MDGNNFIPCENTVNQPNLRESCRLHTEYDTTCARCREAIVPRKQFCSEHASLQKVANKKKKKRRERLTINRRQVRQGQGRRHCRSDSDIDSADEKVQVVEDENGQAQMIVNDAGGECEESDDAERIEVVIDGGNQGEDAVEIENGDEDASMSDRPDPTWKMMVGRRYTYGQYIICRPCGYILWNARLHRSEGVARVCNTCHRVTALPWSRAKQHN